MRDHNPITFAIIGAGARGTMFADWLSKNVGKGCVVAVADVDAQRAQHIAHMHEISPDRVFGHWQNLLELPALATILINSTMDLDHAASTIRALRVGYHVFLEKPMATTLEDCQAIVEAKHESGQFVSVCHSLRYHRVYEEIRRILRSGILGNVTSFHQRESVGYLHQAHSFVRGNWGNSKRSTFMLLAKSCHDLDVISDLIHHDCLDVASFGARSYFTERNSPIGAPGACVEGCPVQTNCPFYAPMVYGTATPWAEHAGTVGLSYPELIERLRTDRYGRCVFHSDNDVVDHQIVAMNYANDITAMFEMTAFTPETGRTLSISCSNGYLEANIETRVIQYWEFWRQNRHTRIEIPEDSGHHGGADALIISNFIEAVRSGKEDMILTSAEESMRTHAIAFAAEQSRIDGGVVNVQSLVNSKLQATASNP